MDKYLLEILKDVNTIIIPGLGALTITNSDTGEIMFMSYLKHDDGKLSAYISEKEGIDGTEAKNLIAKYVREIQAELNKGESYDMFQFGSFIKENDEIAFKTWQGEAIPEEKPKKEKKVQSKIIEVDTKLPEKEKKSDAPSKEIIPETVENAPKEIIKEEVATPIPPLEKNPTTKIESPKEEEKVFNILEKEELNSNITKLEKLRKDKAETRQTKKKGAGFYMLITLVVLLLVGGTYIGFNYQDFKQHIPFLADNKTSKQSEKKAIEKMEEMLGESEFEEQTNETENNDLLEEKSNAEVIEEPNTIVDEVEHVEKPEPKKVVKSSSSNDLRFHIIAGAFSSEANANRLADKLRERGYSTKVGPGRGMNLVSISSYNTREDANAALKDFMDDAPKAWVFEWK